MMRGAFSLLLDLHVHPATAEGEFEALSSRDELHGDPVLILHRGVTASAGDRQTRSDRRVVAVEVTDALEVVDVPGGFDPRGAHVTDGESLHVDRILLPLVGERATSPADPDARRNR